MSEHFIDALILGVVEGLTEFIPVSSTGHLILLGELLGFTGDLGDTFKVMIQLGAILAVCVVYFETLLHTLLTLPTDPRSRRFAAGVLVAFLPAAVLGAAFHSYIKGVLFSPWVVCVTLILGGLMILFIERRLPATHHEDARELPLGLCFAIGLFQCMALVPGVSRSGATIIGALMLRVDRKAAAEFSFFLAIPTMLGAFAYDGYKNWSTISQASDGAALIAIGFLTAFGAAVLVVRSVVAFVGRHGFAPFAWYRIGLGLFMLAVLLAI